jgi:hypothetical protein
VKVLKKFFKKNIQQSGETFVVNKQVNESAGKKIMKDTMSMQDFIDTTVLSFLLVQ